MGCSCKGMKGKNGLLSDVDRKPQAEIEGDERQMEIVFTGKHAC